MSLPLVNILMLTYNHEAFIRQSIDSILSQKTSFEFSIVIGDDCSTDQTQKILLEYKKKFPNKIDLILHSYNVGMMENHLQVRSNCHAKYIACCDGDDYWTDDLKLQKQIDFLESNSDYSICYHRVSILTKDGKIIPEFVNKSNENITYTIEDLANFNLMHTPSVVFRNKLYTDYPIWFKNLGIGDYGLHLLNASYGNIYYIPEFMATYRIHLNGVWSLKPEHETLKTWTDGILILKSAFAFNKVVEKRLEDQYVANLVKLCKILFFQGKENEAKALIQTGINNSNSVLLSIIDEYSNSLNEIQKLKSTFFYKIHFYIFNPQIFFKVLSHKIKSYFSYE